MLTLDDIDIVFQTANQTDLADLYSKVHLGNMTLIITTKDDFSSIASQLFQSQVCLPLDVIHSRAGCTVEAGCDIQYNFLSSKVCYGMSCLDY